MSNTTFILAYSVFLSFVFLLTPSIAADGITGPYGSLEIPVYKNVISYAIDSVVFFFSLLFINSSFALFGILILSPLAIAMLWAIMELIR